jgi:hypothetical protein
VVNGAFHFIVACEGKSYQQIHRVFDSLFEYDLHESLDVGFCDFCSHLKEATLQISIPCLGI